MNLTQVCCGTKAKAIVSLALVFASLIIAIALVTKGAKQTQMVTFFLIAGYFACERIIKASVNSNLTKRSDTNK